MVTVQSVGLMLTGLGLLSGDGLAPEWALLLSLAGLVVSALEFRQTIKS